MTEEQLKQHGRSKIAGSPKALKWSADKSASFKNFASCYDKKLANQQSASTLLAKDEVLQYIKSKEEGQMKDGFVEHFWRMGAQEWEVMELFEDVHDCAGFCRPALFYFSKDISAGPPKQSCLKTIMKEV